MKFDLRFLFIWWGFLIILSIVLLLIPITTNIQYLKNMIFYVLIIILIYPLFSEIDIFGFKVKKDIADIKEKIASINITVNNTQGTSDPIAPLTQNIQNNDNNFTDMEKKIISTLYKYQKQTFPNDITKRWTFIITPVYKEYPDYLVGISGLLKKGLISVSPTNYHCLLTNEGLDYIDKNKNLYDENIIFTF